MADPDKPTDPGSFEDRLRAARAKHDAEQKGQPVQGRFSGGDAAVGLRIAAEILAAIIVGAGAGLLLDRWLGTSPWLLILFFFLGVGAAFVNLLRTARELDARSKRRKAGGDEE